MIYKIKLLLFISLMLNQINFTLSQPLTRGANNMEIYIGGETYVDSNGYHYGIFHSTDNGINLTLQYEYVNSSPQGIMPVGIPLGDAEPSVLYNYLNYHEFWISNNFGVNWEIQDDTGWYKIYATGRVSGEVFKLSQPYEGIQKLYYSTDYGANYILKNDSCWGYKIDVGLNEGEVFILKDHLSTEKMKILRSFDYGVNFDTVYIDSSYYSHGIDSPSFARGANVGELYFMSWVPPSNYRIYFSTNYGNTFELRYESEYIDLYYHSIKCTAGRENGSFYVLDAYIDEITHDHSWVCINYSGDTAKTFKTYCHELDNTVSIGEIATFDKTTQHLQCYPNPFTTSTKITFSTIKTEDVAVDIYSLDGKLIKRLYTGRKEKGNHSLFWDGKDAAGKEMPAGVYNCMLKTANGMSVSKKIIKL